MQSSQQVAISIVNYGDGESLKHLLAEVTSYVAKPNYILVYDSFSSDNNKRLVAELCESFSSELNISLFAEGINPGYGEGHNYNAKYLESIKFDGIFVVVNPDVIFTEHALVDLLSHSKQGVAAMLAAKDEHGQVLYNCLRLQGISQHWEINNDPLSSTDYLAGSFFGVHINDYLHVGGFQDHYFLYWEEVDLSLRLKAAGVNLVCSSGDFIVRASNSLGTKINAIYYLIRNVFLFVNDGENRSRSGLYGFVFKNFLRYSFWSLRYRKTTPIISFCKGLYDGLRGVHGVRC